MTTTVVTEEIVSLSFDFTGFEKGVVRVMQRIADFISAFDFTVPIESLGGLDAAADKVDFSGTSSALDTITSKLSTLRLVGIQVLSDIASKAIESTRQFVSANLFGPMRDGFAEYQTQMNAIQTIMANTASQGTTLNDVSAALDELNAYADRTIYNFTEMTRNIGTFTTAGVELDTSVDAIKGIANLAAVSGSNSQQASNAMYQLSQAVATGVVRLQDWNSVVNAGMGGKVFQDELVATARASGVAIDSILESSGGFRASLQEEWLTSEILLNTLAKFTGDMSEEQLKALGYTEEEIARIMELGRMANAAATEVKTLTQLGDTISEAIGSGWSETWRIIFGDFEEAKGMFTEISNIFGDVISKSAESRNSLLQGWSDLGGRELLVETFITALKSLLQIIQVVKDGWAQVFPPKTAQDLMNITQWVANLVEKFKMGYFDLWRFQQIVKGVAIVLDIVWMAIKAVLTPLIEMFSGVSGLGDAFLDAGVKFYIWARNLRDGLAETEFFPRLVADIGRAIAAVIAKAIELKDAFLNLDIVKQFVTFLGSINREKVADWLERLRYEALWLQMRAHYLIGRIKELKDSFLEFSIVQKIIGWFQNFDGSRLLSFFDGLKERSQVSINLWSGLKSALGWVWDIVKRMLPSFYNLASNGAEIVRGFLSSFMDGAKNFDFVKFFRTLNAGLLTSLLVSLNTFARGGGIREIFDSVLSSLKAWQNNLKAGTLLKIAAAIGIITLSVIALSSIDRAALTQALSAITVMFAQLFGGSGALSAIDGAGLAKKAAGILILSVGLLIMASAIKKFGDMDGEEISKGLIAIGSSLTVMIVALKGINKTESNGLIKSAIAIGIIAVALIVLSKAVSIFGNMDTETLVKGLLSIGVALAAFIIFAKGVDGKKVLTASIAMGLLGLSLMIVAKAVGMFAAYSWEELGRGLAGLGGSLLILIAALYAIPKGVVVKAGILVVVSAAMVILAEAVSKFGALSWDEIGRGLAAMGGALLILAIALYAMSGTLAGSAALLAASIGMLAISIAMEKLGGLSWDEILRGLAALAGALLVLGLGTLILTPILPAMLALAAVLVLIGVAATAFGVGIFLLSVGLTALSVSAAAIAAGITIIAGAVLGLIPALVEALGLAIIQLAQVLIDGAPVFFEAAKVLILGLLDVLVEVTPQIVEGLVVLLVTLLQTIAEHLPDFLQAGFDILIEFLRGIADNIQDVVEAAIDIVVNFINGVASKIPDVIQAGFNLLISFIDGITRAVEEDLPRLIESIEKLGNAIIDGLAQTIRDRAGDVLAALSDIVTGAIDAIKEMLGISSPSKVFMEIGDNMMQGLVNSIVDSKDRVESTMQKLSQTIQNGIESFLETDLNMAPTIRPVVDFGAASSGLQRFSSRYTSPTMQSPVFYNDRPEEQPFETSTGVNEGGDVFYQYNYSPKALDPATIYRNTNSLLARARLRKKTEG